VHFFKRENKKYRKKETEKKKPKKRNRKKETEKKKPKKRNRKKETEKKSEKKSEITAYQNEMYDLKRYKRRDTTR
jgi:hypothetical protein